MIINNDKKLGFDDVLVIPKVSTINSRKDVDLDTNIKFPNSGLDWNGMPIMASNMDFVGTFEMGMALQNFHVTTAVNKFYSTDEWVNAINQGLDLNYNFITFGLDNIEHIHQKISDISARSNKSPSVAVFDVPNGYIKSFCELISIARKEFPELGILAGNVVTPDGVKQLMESGADGVKVGIGSGGVCSTSATTGVGYPQLAAVIECSEEAKKSKGFIISDGGIKTSGDIVKAYSGGAGFVMLGSVLAGHEEGKASLITKDGKFYRKFYGMSSGEAMTKHYGGVANYRAPEGISILVEDRGSVENTVNQLLGGIRSACTYINAKNISEIFEKSTFVTV
ncbi:MAG: GMP reductase [Rickettsiales bacterium]|nr:GMP reductase [Rickettsiales bacterium]|tara:strand:- start:5 stop:1018 length:1014 start_codon:yes stop_codon:yes gene_type:complete